MTKFDLPPWVVNFLSSNSQFIYDAQNCEAGEVRLKSYDELFLTEVFFDGNSEENDPHANEEGYYSVVAVDLVKECPAYGSEGILISLGSIPRSLLRTEECKALQARSATRSYSRALHNKWILHKKSMSCTKSWTFCAQENSTYCAR